MKLSLGWNWKLIFIWNLNWVSQVFSLLSCPAFQILVIKNLAVSKAILQSNEVKQWAFIMLAHVCYLKLWVCLQLSYTWLISKTTFKICQKLLESKVLEPSKLSHIWSVDHRKIYFWWFKFDLFLVFFSQRLVLIIQKLLKKNIKLTDQFFLVNFSFDSYFW